MKVEFILVKVSLDKATFLYFCVASGVWSYCVVQVFKGGYPVLFSPFAKNVTSRNV